MIYLDFGTNIKHVFIHYRKWNSLYEERLRKATSLEETTWLYHELSRFNIELKQYELSRVYARKCIQDARKSNNQRWIINAMMLITKVDMLQHNRNDAKLEMESALQVAKDMDDEDLVKYLEKVLNILVLISRYGILGDFRFTKRCQQYSIQNCKQNISLKK